MVNILFLPLPRGEPYQLFVCILCVQYFLAWLILVLHLQFFVFLDLVQFGRILWFSAFFGSFLICQLRFYSLNLFQQGTRVGLNNQFVYFGCSLFLFLAFLCRIFKEDHFLLLLLFVPKQKSVFLPVFDFFLLEVQFWYSLYC